MTRKNIHNFSYFILSIFLARTLKTEISVYYQVEPSQIIHLLFRICSNNTHTHTQIKMACKNCSSYNKQPMELVYFKSEEDSKVINGHTAIAHLMTIIPENFVIYEASDLIRVFNKCAYNIEGHLSALTMRRDQTINFYFQADIELYSEDLDDFQPPKLVEHSLKANMDLINPNARHLAKVTLERNFSSLIAEIMLAQMKYAKKPSIFKLKGLYVCAKEIIEINDEELDY